MSEYTLDVAHNQQVSGDIHEQLQRTSRFLPYVNIKSITGSSASYEVMGAFGDVTEVTSVHADTVISEADHTRRTLFIKDFTQAKMLDHQDSIRILIDPLNVYSKYLAATMGRKVDDTIVEALLGTANTGSAGAGTQVLPTAQKIAAGGTKLTFEKLLDVSETFKTANHYGDVNCALTPKALRQLLEQTEIQSVDYNVMRSLMSGNVETFMGIKFFTCNVPELVDNDKVVFFGDDALIFGKADNVILDTDRRADKNNNVQVMIRHSFGAVRLEDALVIEVSHT